jgi:hypothetical protein
MNLPSLENICTAPIFAVCHIDHAVLGNAKTMHDAELIRARIREVRIALDLAIVLINRLVGECTPHALERAGIGVVHDDAMVAIAIGYEQLIGGRVDPAVGRAMNVGGVGVAPCSGCSCRSAARTCRPV